MTCILRLNLICSQPSHFSRYWNLHPIRLHYSTMIASCKLCLVILTVASIAAMVAALPTGAPLLACQDMTPHHRNNTAACSDPPFNLTVSVTSARCGEQIQVNLKGLSDSNMFRGFFVQARELKKGKISQDPMGEFFIDPGDTIAKTIDCPGGSSKVSGLCKEWSLVMCFSFPELSDSSQRWQPAAHNPISLERYFSSMFGETNRVPSHRSERFPTFLDRFTIANGWDNQ